MTENGSLPKIVTPSTDNRAALIKEKEDQRRIPASGKRESFIKPRNIPKHIRKNIVVEDNT